MPNVLNGIELAFTSCLPASSARACSSVLSLLNLLHLRCASLQLVKLYGSPPRETGTSSSTSALIGCGVFNVLSTGLPQMAHTSYAASTLALSCLRRQPLLTRSLRRLLMWPPHMYEPRGVMDASMIIFAVGLLECRYRGSRIWTLPCLVGAPHHLRIPLPRVCFMGAFGGIRTRVHTRPQGRESNKDSRPVRSTTDSYEGIPAGGFEHHGSTGLACLSHWGMSTLTGVGGACPICRSDRTVLRNPRS